VTSIVPAAGGAASASGDVHARLIDRWFPCGAVDAAVGTPAGSGRSEKALFTWFASRPIAQARAAVLTTLLPDDPSLHGDVEAAVEHGEQSAIARLSKVIRAQYPQGRPIVLDVFSGRGIIPLEAARLSVVSVGTDLSPVATLAGKLLADYPLRDWSSEPPLPFVKAQDEHGGQAVFTENTQPRLLRDVRAILAEVDHRMAAAVERYYPKDAEGRFPWAYLWAVTIPCDHCKRRFPLVGSLVLRHPYTRTNDPGQSFRLLAYEDQWQVEVMEGVPDQQPTFSAAVGKRGKAAGCLFCGHLHPLGTVKAKGFAGEYRDALLLVADGGDTPRKTFRPPTEEEVKAAESVDLAGLAPIGAFSAVPNERIPPGNNHTIRASAYGYRTYGDLLCARQSVQFTATVRAIRACRDELCEAGLSEDYVTALTAYAAANVVRRLRRSTRGTKLLSHGNSRGTAQNRVQADHIFSDESKVAFQFDFLETGPGEGPGTWGSIAETGNNALRKVIAETASAIPGRFRRASAVALPFRDSSVDAVICDPPYYNMIDYADASDLFYVWLKRCLFDVLPDLFGSGELQDKREEIIVKNGHAPGEHRTKEFYEQMLSRGFAEARRVLRPDGHLIVVFGHSDPDAWKRLLGALREAGFVVTSSWPSRTETASTGVASIKVTVTIGCRVAAPDRKPATVAQVDREVRDAVKAAARQWDQDGLALTDQMMAAYGPAMEVYGRYSRVLMPSGEADLDRYLNLARTAVRDATALRLDELPLETFDAPTRFAVFWHRLYGRSDVPKGEGRFLAQADNLRIEDLRLALLSENKSGYRLRLDDPGGISDRSSTFEIARAMAAAWERGGTEAAAAVIAEADRLPNDEHLWAVVGELASQLPAADPVAKSLAAVQRNAGTIGNLVKRTMAEESVKQAQMTLDWTTQETP
jgi:putative DNA methylase